MAQVTFARKLAIAGNVIGSRVRSSRLLGAAQVGASAAWHSVTGVFHRLWHEVTGFMFLALAVIGTFTGVREYHKYQAAPDGGTGHLVAATIFSVVFAWFGVSSFWRSRRPRKNGRHA